MVLKKKTASLFMAVVMFMSFILSFTTIPFTVKAYDKTPDEIRAQITSTYNAAKNKNGGNKFFGLCGTYVRYQLEVLNITSNGELAGNGNQWWGKMTAKSQTSKGYKITTFSGKNCINDIVSAMGPNVYNIVVGFKHGTGSDGYTYGHVLFIHAIINGTVYYSDSFTYAGIPEGGVQERTISGFYSAYSAYTFDGAGVFSYDIIPFNPYISITGYDPLPSGKLPQGKSYPVKGIVSGYPNINHVWGGVYNRDGSKTAQYLDKYVDTGSYNLATYFDPYIIFNNLPVGYYTYKIEATTTDGQYKEIHSDFQIGDPPPSTYTVSLNVNGGSVSPTSITVSANGTYSGLPTPSRTGYDFTGWFTASSGGDKKENGSPIASNSDHSLYAHWSAKKVTVTFHRNQNGNDTDTVQEVFTYGTSNQKFGYNTDGSGRYKKMNDPSVGFGEWTKTGYNLLGWSKSKNDTANQWSTYSGVSDEWINSNSPAIDLYGVWKAKSFNAKLVYNDGTEKTDNIKITYDSSYNLPDASRTGYNFIGWYTQPEGGVAITPDTKVAITDTQTLYAQWSQVKFLITFNANGGTSEMRQKLVSSDNKYGVLPSAEKIGYEFDGWYLDEAFTKQITEDTIVKITKNQEIYAKWTQKKYTVTFEVNGGTVDMKTKKVVAGKVYGVLPEAEKNGFEFAGWFTESGKEITSDSIVELTADIVLYAKWRLRGDVDADGDVDVADVVLLQRWLLAGSTTMLNDWQAGDLCEDGRIDVFDLCLIKRLLIERIGD